MAWRENPTAGMISLATEDHSNLAYLLLVFPRNSGMAFGRNRCCPNMLRQIGNETLIVAVSGFQIFRPGECG